MMVSDNGDTRPRSVIVSFSRLGLPRYSLSSQDSPQTALLYCLRYLSCFVHFILDFMHNMQENGGGGEYLIGFSKNFVKFVRYSI